MIALLVDGDSDTRHMYAEYLRLGNWTTEEADDGRDALALAIKHRPSVIVTETQLPGISGIDLCRLLRRDETTESIPIVMLTADAVPADLKKAQEAGADAVLTKPCLPDQLAREILRVVLSRSEESRSHSSPGRQGIPERIARSDDPLRRSRSVMQKVTLKRSHLRRDTLAPPIAPPALMCPNCDRQLTYDHSHVGGVNERNSEQWDYFTCSAGCGRFQYRVRTRKLRQVS